MIVDYTKVDHIYIVCGKTDMRKSIDGLAAIVQGQFNLNAFDNCVFFSAEVVVINTKRYSGMVMDLCYCV